MIKISNLLKLNKKRKLKFGAETVEEETDQVEHQSEQQPEEQKKSFYQKHKTGIKIGGAALATAAALFTAHHVAKRNSASYANRVSSIKVTRPFSKKPNTPKILNTKTIAYRTKIFSIIELIELQMYQIFNKIKIEYPKTFALNDGLTPMAVLFFII